MKKVYETAQIQIEELYLTDTTNADLPSNIMGGNDDGGIDLG